MRPRHQMIKRAFYERPIPRLTPFTYQAESTHSQKARCECCGGSFWSRPGPVLIDRLWKKISKRWDELLCDLCVRKRLGRPITERDLKDVPWNTRYLYDPDSIFWQGTIWARPVHEPLIINFVSINELPDVLKALGCVTEPTEETLVPL